MREPTMTSAPPVAHDGMDAKIGAKKTEMKNAKPVVMAVRPVLPPSGQKGQVDVTHAATRHAPLIPVALSMKAVTGLVPMRAPMLMAKASTQYAIVEFSKSSVTGSRNPANLAMEYRVPVVSTRNRHVSYI